MAMAAFHMGRNNILFISAALFITLAVCLHLSPFIYFPILPFHHHHLLRHDINPSCVSSLHRINNNILAFNSHLHNISWNWISSPSSSYSSMPCHFHKLRPSDASDLLNGSWIVVAGDSQARFIVLSLLNLLLTSPRMNSVKTDLFQRHTNYQILLSEFGIKLDFIWAPFVSNLTELLSEFKQNKTCPHLLVLGAGLWHMLHVSNQSDYGHSLQVMRNSLLSLPQVGRDGSMPHLFWIGMPTLINSMLNTVEKKEKMGDAVSDAYERELLESKILHQTGGPLLLLDLRSLSRICGSSCTLDGMHYDEAVYQAAVHVMLNALLVQTYQTL